MTEPSFGSGAGVADPAQSVCLDRGEERYQPLLDSGAAVLDSKNKLLQEWLISIHSLAELHS